MLKSYDIEVIIYTFFKILSDTTHTRHFSKFTVNVLPTFEYASYASSVLKQFKKYKSAWEESLLEFVWLLYPKIYNNTNFSKFEKEMPLDKFLFSYYKTDEIITKANIIFKNCSTMCKNFIINEFNNQFSKIHIESRECVYKIICSYEEKGTLGMFYIIGQKNGMDVLSYTTVMKTDGNFQMKLAMAIHNFFYVIEKK